MTILFLTVIARVGRKRSLKFGTLNACQKVYEPWRYEVFKSCDNFHFIACSHCITLIKWEFTDAVLNFSLT